jgi:Porin PorA
VRRLSVVLVALGAFLIVVGPMLRLYAYPRLAVAPQDIDTVSTLVGPGATIFDTSSLKEIQTDLTTKVKTVGDVRAARDHGHNVDVWVSQSSTRSADGVVRSRSIEREAFDATTARAVNCCGEFVSETQGVKTPVRHRGLLVKFPFDTQKQGYDFWDGDLGRTVPIKYVDTEQLKGLSVYKFAQTIPPTRTGTVDAPRSVLGLSGSGNVKADQMYSNTRTLWVEPVTGVIVNRTEAQDNTLRYGGQDRLTTTKVTSAFDDKTVQANIDKYAPLAGQLHLVQAVLPWLLPVVGVLLLLGGLALGRRRRTQPDTSADADAPDVALVH